MRVTQNSMTRTYMRNLNNNLNNMNKSNERLNSQRSFSRISEAPSEAAKAFSIREQLYKNEQFETNMRDAAGEITAAESNLDSTLDVLKTAKERLVRAATGTLNQEQRDIMADELRDLSEQVLQFSNAKFGSKYLFSGTGNEEAPFQVADDGTLSFNGTPVDAAINIDEFTKNGTMYIDAGIGMVFSGSEVDDRSAIKFSTSGVDAFGWGTSNVDGTEIPNNIYSFLQSAADSLEAGDKEVIGKHLEHLDTIEDKLVLEVTDMGTRANFLDKTSERLKDENLYLKETQKAVEGVNLEGETINMKSYEMSWMVSLQIGSKIIPPSIFDFMR